LESVLKLEIMDTLN